MNKIFTSESVTEGHPDKMCDIIADSILDAILEQDKDARVACEVTVTTNLVNIMGEVTTSAKVDIEKIVRETIVSIGYNKDDYGFNGYSCQINNYLHTQSPDIAIGVDSGGAGDQGIMFGYACTETESLMPLPISLAHQLAERLAIVRKNNIIPYLRPDGKTQVTLEYEDDIPKRLIAIVISSQHDADISHRTIEVDIIKHVIKKVVPIELLDNNTKYYINPTGKFIVGGPHGDSGLTGRKIIVDTYGGYARHGGGSFSGKDATKVDRSAAYMARYIAKNIVASGITERCEIGLAYAIGKKEPLSILINTFSSSFVSEREIVTLVKGVFDLTPAGIINRLQLYMPIYSKVACYGHFGKDGLSWEKLDMVQILNDKISVQSLK